MTAFDRFWDLSLDLLCVADFDGHFLQVSSSWERVLGWPAEDLVRRPFMDFIHPDDVERTKSQYALQLAGSSAIRFENRYRRADGAYRWLSWNAVPVVAENRIYAVARDTTEAREAASRIEELNADLSRRLGELRAAHQDLETFSYSVAHDLRSPLRAIDGFARLLDEECASRLDDEGRRLLEVVRSNARRMGAMVDDLLEFSRLGRRELVRSKVDMEALARAVADEVLAAAAPPPPEIRIAPLPDASGDASSLRAVLENLLGNAVKYSSKRPAPRVEVGGRRENGGCVYFIKDNGAGFDMRYADKLFKVFQRLHRAEDYAGTGVGLAIVERVVRKHGGAVWAEGRPGEGATFYFSLPEGGPHGP